MRIIAVTITLMLATCLSFGQSNVEATSAKEAEADASTQEVKKEKKNEPRKVFKIVGETERVGGQEVTKEAKKEVVFDEKGGVIVPEARKGIRVDSPASRKQTGAETPKAIKGEARPRSTTGAVGRETVKETQPKKRPTRE